MAASTAARHLSSQRRFFKFLQAEGLREDDPSAGFKRLRLTRPLPKLLSLDETERLIAAARDLPRWISKRTTGCAPFVGLKFMPPTGLNDSLPRRAVQGDHRMLMVRGKCGRERHALSEPATWLPTGASMCLKRHRFYFRRAAKAAFDATALGTNLQNLAIAPACRRRAFTVCCATLLPPIW